MQFMVASKDIDSIEYLHLSARHVRSGSVIGNESAIVILDPEGIMTSVVFDDFAVSFQGSAEVIRGIDWVASGGGISGDKATASWTWNGISVVVTFTRE